MSSILVQGLLRIARAIGRWILEQAAKRGGEALRFYILGRVDLFRERLAKATASLARAKTSVAKRRLERRVRWLKGRIRRWMAAAAWLAEKKAELEGCAGDAFDALAKAHPEIPRSAACEKLTREAA